MILRDAINHVLDAIVTTLLQDIADADPKARYRMITMGHSCIITVSRNGMPVMVLKPLYIGSTKHANINVHRACTELMGIYTRLSAQHPTVGLLVAGVLSESARTYLQKAGVGYAMIDHCSLQTAFASVGADIQDVTMYHNLDDDQLDRVTEQLLAAHKSKLSVFIESLINGTLQQSGTAVLMLPEDMQTMTATNRPLAGECLERMDYVATGKITPTERADLLATLHDALDASFCAGFRQGRSSVIPTNHCHESIL